MKAWRYGLSDGSPTLPSPMPTGPAPLSDGPGPQRRRVRVLTAWIDAIEWQQALEQLSAWGHRRESRYVCLCNVHSVVTARQEPAFQQVVNDADLALPDGAPIAAALRLEGHATQRRINGPDLMWRHLRQCEREGLPVFFYGSTDETLAALKHSMLLAFPRLKIAGLVSPPFRELTPEEDEAYVQQINASGAAALFVGLGCPKQEHWMAAHRGRIHAVMLGVGAAFDYHAGIVKRAPKWMQRNGLEWVYRLISEPRRLVWRYLQTNTIFLVAMLARVLRGPREPAGS